MEYDHARSLWMAGIRHMGDMETTEADYETQFSMMVEQEVERRLFQVRKPKVEFFFKKPTKNLLCSGGKFKFEFYY